MRQFSCWLLACSDQKHRLFGLVSLPELLAFSLHWMFLCLCHSSLMELRTNPTQQEKQDYETLMCRTRGMSIGQKLSFPLYSATDIRAEEHGQGQHWGEWLGIKTAKHLPLSLGVQAALEVLALPTQEECDMLQPSQAKLSQASFVGYLGFYLLYTLYSIVFSLAIKLV